MLILQRRTVFVRVTPARLPWVLTTPIPVVYLTKNGEPKYDESDHNQFTTDQWMKVVERGALYHLHTVKWECAEHMDADDLLVVPVDARAVFAQVKQAAVAAPAQTQMELNNKPAEATN